jgi:hypothetical protein
MGDAHLCHRDGQMQVGKVLPSEGQASLQTLKEQDEGEDLTVEE